MVATNLIKALRKQLQAQANPGRAEQQRAYTKSAMPYAGLTAAQLRTLTKSLFKEHPISEAVGWEQIITAMWRNARYREERYAALELLGYKKYRSAWLCLDHLPLIEELITTGAWWDYVDNIASNFVGDHLLRREPTKMTKVLRQWSRHDDLWLRRTSIIAQLKFYEDTDTELLFYAIEGSISDKDFFARKAIGWALRQHSKTATKLIAQYITDNSDRLSTLSIREGLKHLEKQK